MTIPNNYGLIASSRHYYILECPEAFILVNYTTAWMPLEILHNYLMLAFNAVATTTTTMA